MANTEYLLPDGSFYNDTEQGKEILLPDGSFINEQAAAAAGAIMNQIQQSNLGADLFNGTLL
jgi:hypothetical protein